MSQRLYSWGHYPPHPQAAQPCHWRAEVGPTLANMAAQHGTTLPFGNGRSYGDSCLASSDHVVHLRTLDRFIDVNWQTGLICAEAGVTLAELLALSIPNGWFLPVTPGTQFITLGGALANDVHGKNHHVRGTFGCHVPRFGLIRSDRVPLVCSAQDNADLYAATIGGLGLTGIVDWLELQLIPIRSSQIDATHVRFGSLDEFFALSAELDGKHEYTVAWIDCLARGPSTGRGIYMAGDHAQSGPQTAATKSNINVPVTPPFSVINHLSLRLFNSACYRAHRAVRQRSQINYEPFFYPLDRILNWNRIYGPRGFQQYQCVVPENNAPEAIRELLGAVAAAHSGSFLAVLKRFGKVISPGLLSFPQPGATLALDFPEQGDSTARLFARLDTIVREAGGRQYPAKDAHMSSQDFQHAYPAWPQLQKLKDPALSSRLWERLSQ